jgi:acetyl-CoA carboxylase carboxyl transferase subunit beta
MPAMREFFHRRGKFRPQAADDGADHQIPDDLWVKCPNCGDLLYSKELEHHARVCPKCGYHLRLRARQRIAHLADAGSFREWDAASAPRPPRLRRRSGPYAAKLEATQRKSGEPEALVSGQATIDGRPSRSPSPTSTSSAPAWAPCSARSWSAPSSGRASGGCRC